MPKTRYSQVSLEATPLILLDEASVLTCMAYVDLNPIRAVMAKTPETSDYTSIKQRVGQLKAKHKKLHPASKLFKFAGNTRAKMPQGLPYVLKVYIKLVDETGRIRIIGVRDQYALIFETIVL